MEIHLVLVDDWELRGNGSGDARKIQFEPMRKLCSIYEEHGFRGTYNVEVMQQLHHRGLGHRHTELRAIADEWERQVLETYDRGHDIQLHVHPQWRGASYDGSTWSLPGDWNLLRHDTGAIREMLVETKAYLEGLLRQANSDYRCVSFRSGAWCIAPHDDVLTVLGELGIVFDMSICAGLHYDLEQVQLDYRRVDEPFLPYYPSMTDARRVSDKAEPIICCPTFSFPYIIGARRKLWAHLARRLAPGYHASLFQPPSFNVADDYSSEYWSSDNAAPRPPRHSLWDRIRRFASAGTPAHIVADLANMSFVQMSDMVDEIRRRAARAGRSPLPVILENHTKDIGSFEPIVRFCGLLARQRDVRVVTAAEIARGFEKGRYLVRRSSSPKAA